MKQRSIFVLMLFLAVNSIYAGEIFKDPQGTFTCRIPDGFKKAPENISSGTFICAYFIPAEAGQIPITLGIQRLGGTIGNERLTTKDLPKITKTGDIQKASLSRAIWKEYEIDVINVYMGPSHKSMVSTVAQVPIRHQAIQIVLTGTVKTVDQVRQYLNEILAGFEGETNWAESTPTMLTTPAAIPDDANTSSSVIEKLSDPGVLIFIIGVFVLALLTLIPIKGLVLGLAVCILITGYFIAKTETPELLTVGVPFEILGIVGIMMGVRDLFRKKKKKTSEELPPISTSENQENY